MEKIARRNRRIFPSKRLQPGQTHYQWRGLQDFFLAYDEISSMLTTERDYFELTFDYLKQCASYNTLYVELFFSPAHVEKNCKFSAKHALTVIEEAMKKAEDRFKIKSSLVAIAVRNYGVEHVENVARFAARREHDSLRGFGLAGDEKAFPPAPFKRAFDIAHQAQLGCTAHAGEFRGPDGIIEALDALPVTRIGHGVRAIESPNLMQRLKEEGIHLEICPSSNVALKVYPNLKEHPFGKLYAYGLNLSINSDDPPFFNTSIEQEYQLAKEHFFLSEQAINEINYMAIKSSFASQETKRALIQALSQED
jgi:adenosine deaminase